MEPRQIAGVVIITMLIAAGITAMVKELGWKDAAEVVGFIAALLTAITIGVFAFWLITG